MTKQRAKQFTESESIKLMSAPGAGAVVGRLWMLPSVLWTECPPVLKLIMSRQENHHNHPRHDHNQSKTSIPLPSDSFHDKLFPFDQRDVLIN